MINVNQNARVVLYRFLRGVMTAGGLALLGMIPRLAMASVTIPGIGSGSGTPVWTIYTIGDGAVLYGLLMSIKAFVASASYMHMILFITTLGFLISSAMAVAETKITRVGTSFTMIALITYLAFQLKVDVQIDDTASNYVNVVTGVPALVGLPAAGISEIGYYLTESVEQNFNLPGYSGLELTNGGLFNMTAETVRALHTPVINDMPLRATFNNYFNDCVIPALANGTITINDIMNSSPNGTSQGLITVLSNAASNSIMTQDYLVPGSPGGVSETCYFVYNDIYNTLNTDYPNILDNTMGKAFQVYGATGAAGSLFSTAITSGFTWLTGGSSVPSPQDMVIQSAVMNLMQSGFTYAAAQTGSSPVISSINLQESINQQQSSWWAAGQLFAKLGPLFYVVLYSFVIGLAPIIIVGLFIPKFGGSMASSYFQILLWLALWQPSFAILNYILALFEQNASTSVMASNGVWSMTTHTVVNQAANDYILIGGFLGSLVPMILFAIVKQGSMAFTGFLEAASSKSAIMSAGTSMASGNLNLGNTSMDNMSMNKSDIAYSRVSGSNGTQFIQGAGSLTDSQILNGVGASSGGQAFSQSVTTTRSARMSSAFQSGESAAATKLAGTQAAMGSVYSDLMQQAKEHHLSFDKNWNVVDASGKQVHTALAKQMRTAHDIAVASEQAAAVNGVSQQSAGAAVSAGLSFFGSGGSVTAKDEHIHRNENKDAWKRSAQDGLGSSTTTDSSQSYDRTLTAQQKAAKTISAGIKHLQQEGYGHQGQLQKVAQANDQFSATLSQTRSAISEASAMGTTTTSTGMSAEGGLENLDKARATFGNVAESQDTGRDAILQRQRAIGSRVDATTGAVNNGLRAGAAATAVDDLPRVPGMDYKGTQAEISAMRGAIAAGHDGQIIGQNNEIVESAMTARGPQDAASSIFVHPQLLGGDGGTTHSNVGNMMIFNDKTLASQTHSIGDYKVVGAYQSGEGGSWEALYQKDGSSTYYTLTGDGQHGTAIFQPTAQDARAANFANEYAPWQSTTTDNDWKAASF